MAKRCFTDIIQRSGAKGALTKIASNENGLSGIEVSFISRVSPAVELRPPEYKAFQRSIS